MKAPTMKNAPWAKFTTVSMPKISAQAEGQQRIDGTQRDAGDELQRQQ